MPGNIHCIRIALFIGAKWNENYTKAEYQFYSDNLNPNNSYIAIFSMHQLDQLDLLKKSDKVNILWISDKAVNPVHIDNGPSNTVVVFELKK